MDHSKLLAQNSIQWNFRGVGTSISSAAEAPGKIEKLISQIIGVLTIVAFIYFLFQIIFAGLSFISAEGDKNKMETARKRLTEGVLGLTVVILAVTLAGVLGRLLGISNILNLKNNIDAILN